MPNFSSQPWPDKNLIESQVSPNSFYFLTLNGCNKYMSNIEARVNDSNDLVKSALTA